MIGIVCMLLLFSLLHIFEYRINRKLQLFDSLLNMQKNWWQILEIIASLSKYVPITCDFRIICAIDSQFLLFSYYCFAISLLLLSNVRYCLLLTEFSSSVVWTSPNWQCLTDSLIENDVLWARVYICSVLFVICFNW